MDWDWGTVPAWFGSILTGASQLARPADNPVDDGVIEAVVGVGSLFGRVTGTSAVIWPTGAAISEVQDPRPSSI